MAKTESREATSTPPPTEIPSVRWLAGLAMQGLVFRHGIPDAEQTREEFALWSYRMAQAMLTVESQLHAIEEE